ncbi:MAG: phenylacetate-CoA oxygenase subunit PaaC [Chitinophagaceae bacterium]|nr:phenylacetate-CoA oxygenase subunit PaaC [Chitinophagaceae bacterium]
MTKFIVRLIFIKCLKAQPICNDEHKNARYNFCLRLADNNLILAQRLAEWCSKGPILEEDLAITNMSLDLFGQAESFYDYAAAVIESNSSADELAFLRSEREYLNTLMVEQPNGDFAFTMMKQMLFSAYTKLLYESLSKSVDRTLAGLSAKALKEAKYHLRHSSEWVIRLGNGTNESKERVQFALNELWLFVDDMFAMDENDEALITIGVIENTKDIKPKWLMFIKQILEEANLQITSNTNSISGGIKGIHTEHLGHLLCEMQYLQRAYPGAKW